MIARDLRVDRTRVVRRFATVLRRLEPTPRRRLEAVRRPTLDFATLDKRLVVRRAGLTAFRLIVARF